MYTLWPLKGPFVGSQQSRLDLDYPAERNLNLFEEAFDSFLGRLQSFWVVLLPTISVTLSGVGQILKSSGVDDPDNLLGKDVERVPHRDGFGLQDAVRIIAKLGVGSAMNAVSVGSGDEDSQQNENSSKLCHLGVVG